MCGRVKNFGIGCTAIDLIRIQGGQDHEPWQQVKMLTWGSTCIHFISRLLIITIINCGSSSSLREKLFPACLDDEHGKLIDVRDGLPEPLLGSQIQSTQDLPQKPEADKAVPDERGCGVKCGRKLISIRVWEEERARVKALRIDPKPELADRVEREPRQNVLQIHRCDIAVVANYL